MTSSHGFVREILLPQVHDPRGDLTFVEGGNQIPFHIGRVDCLHNDPVGFEHAHGLACTEIQEQQVEQ